MIHKIALLTPIILKEPMSKSYKETSFYKNTLLSFILNYDKTQQYMFFVGIWKDCDTFSNIETQNELKRFISVMVNVNLGFYYLDKKSTTLISLWNSLASHAYENNYDYYINITDMNIFTKKNWIQPALLRLKQNNNIGFATFIDNIYNEYDVCIVHQKHLQIFNFLFNDNLNVNYWVDWLNKIYPKRYSIYISEFDINKKQPFIKSGNNNINKLFKSDILRLKKHVSYIFQE